MMLKQSIKKFSLALLFGAVSLTVVIPSASAANAKAATVKQQHFASPAAASEALAEAVRAADPKALLAVVGPDARSWLFSGDDVADRESWKRFLTAYDSKHEIKDAADGQAFLLVGDDAWQFPAPIRRKGDVWSFNAEAGREEMLNRRIGRNELDTIQTLRAVVDAQREYAASDADGNGYRDYARKFGSSPGKKDGLYWPVADGEAPSPLGPLLAGAAGYRDAYRAGAAGGKGIAYHGYHYRMLTSQGKDADGGSYSYLVKDKLLGGFAAIAFPAKYGISGVMTFLVNHEGIVFEKDLGPGTEAIATKMQSFNPGAGWKKSP